MRPCWKIHIAIVVLFPASNQLCKLFFFDKVIFFGQICFYSLSSLMDQNHQPNLHHVFLHLTGKERQAWSTGARQVEHQTALGEPGDQRDIKRAAQVAIEALERAFGPRSGFE